MATETILEGTRAAVSGLTLNSVSNNAAALSSAINGSGYPYARFDIVLATGSNMTATGTVEMYFVQQADGSVYEDGSTTGPVTPERPAWVFQVRAATAVVRVTPLIPIPPDDFKVLIVQKSGQAFSASGNTLSWQPMAFQTS